MKVIWILVRQMFLQSVARSRPSMMNMYPLVMDVLTKVVEIRFDRDTDCADGVSKAHTVS